MSTDAPYQPQADAEPAPAPPTGSSRGCLYGCLFVVVSGLALLVCAGVGSWWWLSSQVEKYTSATPIELPTVDFEEERMTELQTRVDTFKDAIDQGGNPPEDLVLTADEINALIGQNEEMRGKVFVKIEDGQVSGDVSVPVPDAIPGGKGRYFNGSASCDVSMEGGVLIMTLTAAEVNGEPVPQQFIDGMARENLAKELYNNPDTAKVLRRFESVSIEDDKIILKMRRDEKADDAEQESETESDSEAEEESATDSAEDQPVEEAAEKEVAEEAAAE